jgi:hypothetical protein
MREPAERFAVAVFDELAIRVKRLEEQALMGEYCPDTRGRVKGLREAMDIVRRHFPAAEEEKDG